MADKSIRKKRRILIFFGGLLLLGVATTLVFSWGGTGHRLINLKAVMHLPDVMASLKADSLFYRSHASDADFRKNSADTAFFAEGQRHYIDIDWYPDFTHLPHSLDSVIALYGRATVRNEGTQPWATMMVLDSLTAQLARGNISKAESTMADLGHYVGDAHQPLHCTNNFDGQFTGNNGVHSRYETGMIDLYQSSITIVQDSARYIASPLDYVFNYIYQSNSYTDSIMAADTYAKSVSGWNGSGTVPAAYYAALWDKTQGFTRLQFQRATVDLASLWYTAWVNAQLPPPVQYDTITAVVVGQGTLVPTGTIILEEGHDTTLMFAPALESHIDSVKVDGARVDSTTSYTFHNVTSRHTFTVWFGINQYTITASASLHGSVAPSGATNVNSGSSKSFSIIADPDYVVDSVIVDGAKVDSMKSYTFINVMEDHTLAAVFKKNTIMLNYDVAGDWNLISIPVKLDDYSTTAVFPDAISRPFAFGGSYIPMETLSVCTGYWLKFPVPASWLMSGTPLTAESVVVRTGWNMIGSLSITIPISSITSDPPGMVTGEFFGYAGGYSVADSIEPGRGYWVRVNKAGKLILSAPSAENVTNRITIMSGLGMPPPPPAREVSSINLPQRYALEHAYPNPFNPTTTIQYQLPYESKVTLEIFNVIGQKVARLTNGTEAAGYKSVQWDAGNEVSGIYFYRLEARSVIDPARTFSEVRKLLLVK